MSGDFGFEGVPAIEIELRRRLWKARGEGSAKRRIQNEAGEMQIVCREEGFDLRQRDPVLLHVKQQIAAFADREEILPLRSLISIANRRRR